MAADFFPTQDVDSASDVDSSADPLTPLLDVPFAFNTPETDHSNSISGVHARDERRKNIVDAILQKLNTGKLQHGSIKAVAAQFNMSHRWVGELWRIAKRQLASGQAVNVQCRWQGNVGKKHKVVDFSKLSEIPFHQRKTLRAISHCMNVSTSTAHNWLKEKKIRRHSNAIKPLLCEKGRLKRLRYIYGLTSKLDGGFEDFPAKLPARIVAISGDLTPIRQHHYVLLTPSNKIDRKFVRNGEELKEWRWYLYRKMVKDAAKSDVWFPVRAASGAGCDISPIPNASP
ncbi:hypothetical protein DM860_015484 [Cuscuta australis]|uniref:DUF7769 domain-containing protein n=1 Tax=Cuscuta australis TaxID=267555 RepID=A0A328E8T2_9ASTE|nr:hypothetical protein DM860_015484 [Cuscuta australis]